MRAWVASDTGLVRTHNEDAYLVLELGDCLACGVADGLGGMESGEVAAALAVEVVRELLGERLGETPGENPGKAGVEQALQEAIRAAHRRIQEAGRNRRVPMASTLTLAVLAPGLLSVGHVGDSRAYLFRRRREAGCPEPGDGNPGRAGGLRQLTRDHSRVGEMLWRGELTEAQARRHPQRHLLDQAVGTGDSLHIDLVETQLEQGDVVLLCTDGLTAVLDSSEIAEVLAGDDPSRVPGRLVEMANERGGPDNVTVVVAEARWEDAR